MNKPSQGSGHPNPDAERADSERANSDGGTATEGSSRRSAHEIEIEALTARYKRELQKWDISAQTDVRVPQWTIWRSVPQVRLWEGVALSLNIEPTEVNHNPNGWMGDSDHHIFDESDTFKQRIFEATRIALARGQISVRGIVMNEPEKTRVRLAEFAAWGVGFGWNVPPDFGEIAIRTEWARKDAWRLREAAFWLCGRVPDLSAPFDDELNVMRDHLMRAITAGTLQVIGEPSKDDRLRDWQLLRPREVVGWAVQRFPKFPFDAQDIPAPAQTPVTDYMSGRVLIAGLEYLERESSRRRASGENAVADALIAAHTSIERLRNKTDLARIDAESAKEPTTPKTNSVAPGHKRTLNTLGAYFARRFKFDPRAQRNGATGKVRNELAKYGLKLDDKTIRDLMKAGSASDDDLGESHTGIPE